MQWILYPTSLFTVLCLVHVLKDKLSALSLLQIGVDWSYMTKKYNPSIVSTSLDVLTLTSLLSLIRHGGFYKRRKIEAKYWVHLKYTHRFTNNLFPQYKQDKYRIVTIYDKFDIESN